MIYIFFTLIHIQITLINLHSCQSFETLFEHSTTTFLSGAAQRAGKVMRKRKKNMGKELYKWTMYNLTKVKPFYWHMHILCHVSPSQPVSVPSPLHSSFVTSLHVRVKQTHTNYLTQWNPNHGENLYFKFSLRYLLNQPFG